jgi:hypothetical protein
MSKKDYILLAKAISATRERILNANNATDEQRNEQLRGVRRTAAHIADALLDDNENFDISRFLVACGY